MVLLRAGDLLWVEEEEQEECLFEAQGRQFQHRKQQVVAKAELKVGGVGRQVKVMVQEEVQVA